MLSLITSDGITEYSVMKEMVYVTLAAITGTTFLVSYLKVKSLKLIWRSGTRRFPSSSEFHRLDYMTGYYVAPTMTAGLQHTALRCYYPTFSLIFHFFHFYPFERTFNSCWMSFLYQMCNCQIHSDHIHEYFQCCCVYVNTGRPYRW